MLSPPDSTIFNVGEVWSWDDGDVWYLLLGRELEREYMMTIKTKDQQCWRVLNLDEGSVEMLKLHTSIFSSGARWVKHS